jgi:quinoprotein glucose dehydrogenase
VSDVAIATRQLQYVLERRTQQCSRSTLQTGKEITLIDIFMASLARRQSSESRAVMSRIATLVVAFVLAACSATEPAPETLATAVADNPWSHWAGDAGNQRYAALEQINAENFDQLRPAWTYVSPDLEWRKQLKKQAKRGGFPVLLDNFQTTPLLVEGVLYGQTPLSQVFALKADTGAEVWVYNPKIPLTHFLGDLNAPGIAAPKSRGVAYAEVDGRPTIFSAAYNAYLHALDATTGQPVASFGKNGRIDLLKGLRHSPIRRGIDYFQTSPPVVVGGTIVVGGSVSDRASTLKNIPGDVRGFDAKTGKLRWTFHTVPTEGEAFTETWEEEAWRVAGASNAWGAMAADPSLGLVYVVTSTPSSDYYGGHRLGDNVYAESIIALNADTGQVAWHFQLIRHGLWDYDPGAAPILADLVIDGRPRKIVAQLTKQGFVFVFDRVTGEPIWPIEDRPVPTSDVAGERTAATQPFPVKPPPYELQGTFERDLIDFTPELNSEARKIFSRFKTGPLFTPPSARGTLTLPGAGGGSNWPGGSLDPSTGVLYVTSVTDPHVYAVKPGSDGETEFDYIMTGFESFITSQGLPIFKPPWSRITAIDLSRGEILWRSANGPGARDHEQLRDLDLPWLGSIGRGGSIATSSLVIVTEGGRVWKPQLGGVGLFAFDKSTGERVGHYELPSTARGVPMTYMYGDRQFIVVAVGSRKSPPQLVALALPK